MAIKLVWKNVYSKFCKNLTPSGTSQERVKHIVFIPLLFRRSVTTSSCFYLGGRMCSWRTWSIVLSTMNLLLAFPLLYLPVATGVNGERVVLLEGVRRNLYLPPSAPLSLYPLVLHFPSCACLFSVFGWKGASSREVGPDVLSQLPSLTVIADVERWP